MWSVTKVHEMLEIHKAWAALATVTFDTLAELEEKSGRNKPIKVVAQEFGQFLQLLALHWDDDGGDGDDKSDTAQGDGADTGG